MSETEEKAVVVPDQNEVDKLIRNHVYTAIGAGMVPVPFVDVVAFVAIELNLVRKLSKLYDKPFKENIAKAAITALVGSVTPVALAPFAFSLLKMIPIIGYTTSAMSLSIMGGAATYAIGRIFSRHFAAGGTIESLSVDDVKSEFTEAYEAGKGIAKEAVRKVKTGETSP